MEDFIKDSLQERGSESYLSEKAWSKASASYLAEYSELEINLTTVERFALVSSEAYMRVPGRRPGARDIAEDHPDPWGDDI